MVDETTLSRKIDARLGTLASRLDALPIHDGTGTDLAAVEAEWRDALDRFDWMHERFTHGELTPDQAARHRHNLSLLAERLPMLHRLGLATPGGDLAAWLEAHPAPRSLAEPA